MARRIQRRVSRPQALAAEPVPERMSFEDAHQTASASFHDCGSSTERPDS